MTKRKCSGWLYPTSRWARYAAHNFACVYCGTTIQECLDDDDNFLTVDHVVPLHPLRGGRRGGNSPTNLVTACYACNLGKGRMSVSGFAREIGVNPSTLSKKVRRWANRDIERFRPMAKLMLGLSDLPGFATPCQFVQDHDWLVKRQWGDSIEGDYWKHLSIQATMFCPRCTAPTNRHTGIHDRTEATGYDDDVPF